MKKIICLLGVVLWSTVAVSAQPGVAGFPAVEQGASIETVLTQYRAELMAQTAHTATLGLYDQGTPVKAMLAWDDSGKIRHQRWTRWGRFADLAQRYDVWKTDAAAHEWRCIAHGERDDMRTEREVSFFGEGVTLTLTRAEAGVLPETAAPSLVLEVDDPRYPVEFDTLADAAFPNAAHTGAWVEAAGHAAAPEPPSVRTCHLRPWVVTNLALPPDVLLPDASAGPFTMSPAVRAAGFEFSEGQVKPTQTGQQVRLQAPAGTVVSAHDLLERFTRAWGDPNQALWNEAKHTLVARWRATPTQTVQLEAGEGGTGQTPGWSLSVVIARPAP